MLEPSTAVRATWPGVQPYMLTLLRLQRKPAVVQFLTHEKQGVQNLTEALHRLRDTFAAAKGIADLTQNSHLELMTTDKHPFIPKRRREWVQLGPTTNDWRLFFKACRSRVEDARPATGTEDARPAIQLDPWEWQAGSTLCCFIAFCEPAESCVSRENALQLWSSSARTPP